MPLNRSTIQQDIADIRAQQDALRAQIAAVPPCECDEGWGCECGRQHEIEALRDDMDVLRDRLYDAQCDLREANGCYCGRPGGMCCC